MYTGFSEMDIDLLQIPAFLMYHITVEMLQ